jgi:hypothetical protein
LLQETGPVKVFVAYLVPTPYLTVRVPVNEQVPPSFAQKVQVVVVGTVVVVVVGTIVVVVVVGAIVVVVEVVVVVVVGVGLIEPFTANCTAL